MKAEQLKKIDEFQLKCLKLQESGETMTAELLEELRILMHGDSPKTEDSSVKMKHPNLDIIPPEEIPIINLDEL